MKKVLFLSISIILAVPFFPLQAFSKGAFTDVPSHYEDAVQYIVNEGYTKGTGNNRFGTSAPIKRIDAAVMLAKVLGHEPTPDAKVAFTDVPNDRAWAVRALVLNGVTSGKSATTFGAYDNITRAEMARWLRVTFNFEPVSITLPFTDVNERFYEDVAVMYDRNITLGKSSTKFGASDSLTRGEFALFLHRAAGENNVWPAPEVENIS